MNIFRKRVFPLLLMISFPFGMKLQAQAQSTAVYIPSVIPPGPNAASLMKFTDVPVSPYTGTADVTVPIYTINAKGLQVPISLSYHTGGVRLKEESGYVGLGWALSAGGSISRTIMDQDDFGTMGKPYFTTVVPQLPGDMLITHPDQPSDALSFGPCFYDMYCSYLVATTSGNEDFTQAFTAGVQQYDMEPDIYYYNFPGHSGKFILTRAGGVVLQKQENIVIQFQGTMNSVNFTITDDQGNKFYFNTTETTSGVGAAEPISTWLISKIVTQQQDSILFNYTNGGGSIEESDINQVDNTYCTNNSQSTTVQNSPITYNDSTLSSIVFSGGQLNFYFDGSRSDLEGGNKLDSVKAYSKNAAGALTYLKQHDFYYSYFNQTYSSPTPYEFLRLRLDSVKEFSASGSLPPYSFIYNNPNPGSASAKHGFSTDHWGYYNGWSNSTGIPSMSILFDPPNNVSQEAYFTYNGANRTPNSPNMMTFALQQVNYPTAGSTVFSYQPNDYDYNNSLTAGYNSFQDVSLHTVDTTVFGVAHGTTSGTINLTNIFPIQPYPTDPSNLTVNVAFRYQINNDSIYKNTSHKIYFTFTYNGATVTQDINSATGSPNSPVFSASFPIVFNTQNNPPAVCSWSIYIDPTIDTVATFSEVSAVFEYQETQQAYDLLENNSFISPASGLRIQSVTNYKDANTIASEKVYNYTYLQDKLGTGTPQQYTYGRLMDFPCYSRYLITTTNTGGYCTGLSLFSSSNTALSSSVNGNIVGYDQVTETMVDPISGADIGKTVYTYVNRPDTPVAYSEGYYLPGILNMGYNLNGSLLSKTEYADYGGIYTPVSATYNYYHTTNRVVYYSPKYIFVYQRSGLSPSLCTPDTTVESETDADFYPSIKSERLLLDSTVNIMYQQQNAALSVVTRSANYYDNPLNYQVTRTSTVDSKGDTLVTKLKYPQDYIPSGQQHTGNTILDSMIGRNMVSETIEKQDSFYYPGSSAGYITGAQLSLFRIGLNYNTIVPDRTYKLSINSPVTNFQPFAISGNTTSLDSRYRQMVSFDQYDAYNNLQQYTPLDQNSVTYLWDYLHVYPITQVKNAVLTDVAATSFEADGTGNWAYTGIPVADPTSITGSYCYNLSNGSITKSGLTSTTTYVLSYWIKNGASPLTIAGTLSGYPIQGKTINTWTYYEYKFTGQTAITVSGSASIDELRLYPATAQMTTFTYSPQVGTTTTCDVDNKVTYYFYDAYQRLKRIKDQDGNIIKTFQYHYVNQNPYNQ